jgi:hypothetical protein
MVYVSGESDMNCQKPLASVVVDSICEGDVTLTLAPAIGALVAVSKTRPCKRPVVPAIAGPAHRSRHAAKSAARTEMRNITRNLPTVASEVFMGREY